MVTRMMTTSEWQLHVSKLSDDDWHRILFGPVDFQLWIDAGRQEYPTFSAMRGKRNESTSVPVLVSNQS